jgi:hypothetical protein
MWQNGMRSFNGGEGGVRGTPLLSKGTPTMLLTPTFTRIAAVHPNTPILSYLVRGKELAQRLEKNFFKDPHAVREALKEDPNLFQRILDDATAVFRPLLAFHDEGLAKKDELHTWMKLRFDKIVDCLHEFLLLMKEMHESMHVPDSTTYDPTNQISTWTFGEASQAANYLRQLIEVISEMIEALL